MATTVYTRCPETLMYHRVDDETGLCIYCHKKPRPRAPLSRDRASGSMIRATLTAANNASACVPIAVALAAKVPFELADEMCRTWGDRRVDPRTGRISGTWTYRLFDNLNIPNMKLDRNYTLRGLVSSGLVSRGRYVVAVRNHAMAVIDGVVMDDTAAGRHVRGVWKLSE